MRMLLVLANSSIPLHITLANEQPLDADTTGVGHLASAV